MPTYEYICPECDHEFERFQSITSEPESECPSCGFEKAPRAISGGTGIIFKGSGFYITDYKKKEAGNGKNPKPSSASPDNKNNGEKSSVKSAATDSSSSEGTAKGSTAKEKKSS